MTNTVTSQSKKPVRTMEFTGKRVSKPVNTNPVILTQKRKENKQAYKDEMNTQKLSSTTEQDETWLTKKEVSEYIKREESTINNWFKSSFADKNNLEIKRKPGQPSMISKSSLDTFLQTKEESTDKSPDLNTNPTHPHTHPAQVEQDHTVISLQKQLASYQDQLQKKDDQIQRILEQSNRQISELVESENKTKILLQNQQILQNQLQEKMNQIIEKTLPLLEQTQGHLEQPEKRKKFLGLF